MLTCILFFSFNWILFLKKGKFAYRSELQSGVSSHLWTLQVNCFNSIFDQLHLYQWRKNPPSSFSNLILCCCENCAHHSTAAKAWCLLELLSSLCRPRYLDEFNMLCLSPSRKRQTEGTLILLVLFEKHFWVDLSYTVVHASLKWEWILDDCTISQMSFTADINRCNGVKMKNLYMEK